MPHLPDIEVTTWLELSGVGKIFGKGKQKM